MPYSEINEIKRAAGGYRKWALEARKKYVELRLQQDPEIRNLYIRAADNVAKKMRNIPGRTFLSRTIPSAQLKQLEASLRAEAERIEKGLQEAMHIEDAVQAGVGYSQAISVDLFDEVKKSGVDAGIDVKDLGPVFARANRQAIEACWARTKYGLFLSDRIWEQGENFRNTVRDIIQESVATGQDAVKTAKLLEQYVRKGKATLARKYPNMMKRMGGRIPGDICYEALRLARTEMTAAFGEGTVAAAQVVPSYLGMKWVLSHNHPMTDICDELAEHDEGLGRGIFAPGSEPLYPAHPNCLCVLVPTHEEPEDFVKRLKRWEEDPSSEPELEKWFQETYQINVLKKDIDETPKINPLPTKDVEIEIVNNEDRIHIIITHTEDYTIPSGSRKGEVIKEKMGFSEIRAEKEKDGVIRLMSMQVDKDQRGKGLATSMIDKVVEEAGQPLRTSGVFSDQGKAVMESLVKKGWATPVEGGDYLIHMGRFPELTKAKEKVITVIASTLEEAEKLAVESGAFTKYADYTGKKEYTKRLMKKGGGDIETANIINNTVLQLKDKYRFGGPLRHIEVRTSDMMPSGAVATMGDGGVLNWNWRYTTKGSDADPNFSLTLGDILAKTPADVIRGTVIHEYGHHIHQNIFAVSKRGDKDAQNLLRRWNSIAQSKDVSWGKISSYARRKNKDKEYLRPEGFAEAFSAFELGAEDRLSPELIEFFKELLLR